MPRTARFIEKNGFYHIISRSLNDNYILKDDQDFIHFLKLVEEAKKQYYFRLFHYVIMNTHFHFLLQALSHKTLSEALSYIKWFYALWFKKKYGWKGPLWRERYKSIPIENENYLYNCGTYIEYNPVRAKICEDPADYRFSSHRKYHAGIIDKLVDDYTIISHPYQFDEISYRSDLTKDLFSRSSAIGSPLFVAKSQNECPEKNKK